MAWGKVTDLDGVVHVFLRNDYGGPTSFRAAGTATEHVSALENLGALARTLGRAWLWLPILLGVVTLARRSLRDAGGESRVAWALLAVSWLLPCLLVLRFDVPPHGLGLYVCQRFHVLPAILLAIPISVGLAPLAERVTRAIVAPLVATVGVVALAAASLPYLGRVHSPAMELHAKNLLDSLPQGAVLIHGQDEFHAGIGYAQWSLGMRRDVVAITWPLTQFHWYRLRIYRRGVPPNYLVPLAEAVLASGKPLFVDRLQRDVIASFPTHPYGSVIRVYPRGTRLPSVEEVYALNVELYSKFRLDYARPGPDDEYATEVHLRYRATWEMIATMLAKVGRPEDAARARATAERLGPHP
jgi:hypothetical protein